MELSDKKIWVFGLLIACPEGNPSPDCPLEQYRKVSYKERLATLGGLTEEEVKEIIHYHNHCLLRRVKSGIITKSIVS